MPTGWTVFLSFFLSVLVLGNAGCANYTPMPDALEGQWTLTVGSGVGCAPTLDISYDLNARQLLGRDGSGGVMWGFRNINAGAQYCNDDFGTVGGSAVTFDGTVLQQTDTACSGLKPVVFGCTVGGGDSLHLHTPDHIEYVPYLSGGPTCEWARAARP